MDIRAVAAFRIGLALTVLLDLLLLRVPGLGMFYTDDGVLPRSALAETAPTLAQWSLHAISGSIWAQALLVGCTAVAATALLVGYRPRIGAVASALLLASLHARNPFLVNGGDTILLSLLFLGAFLPLDAAWSLQRRRRDGGTQVVSVATATVLLHIKSIYAINALLKFRSEAWMNGVAVRRIFQLQDFVYLLGPTLAEYPALLTAINWLWIALLFGSVLLVAGTDRVRTLTVAAFVGAHLGMAATIRLGAFPFVMIAALLLFLPARVWDHVERRVGATGVESRLTSFSQNYGVATKPWLTARSPRVRRGARTTLSVVLVCFLLTTVSWQAVSADLVDTPSAEANGMLDTASWGFFAPNPPDAYSWYVVAASQGSGERVDLVDGGAVAFDRPPNAMDRYPSTLWKRYATKGRGVDVLAPPAAAYFCERSGDGVESVTIYRVDQPVDEEGPVGEPTRHELATATCD